MFFTILLLMSMPELMFQHAIQLTKHKHYEASENIFATIDVRKLKQPDLYNFHRLLNNFSLNNKHEAQKYCKCLFQSFTYDNLAIRHQVLSKIMGDDLKEWKNDDIADIARDMKQVFDRLDTKKRGKETQRIQKSVVDKLSRLIKQIENKKEQEEKQKQQKNNQQKQKQQQKADKPQDDSKPATETGPGVIDRKKVNEYAKIWGSLPPRDRAAAMRELTKEMPDRYREVIIEYFRKLSKEDGR